MFKILNTFLIAFSLIIIIINLKKTNLPFKITNLALSFLISYSFLLIIIYENTNNLILTLKFFLLYTSSILLVNIISIYITSLLQKINNQAGAGFQYFIFFYTASPIAILSICLDGFPNELFISNCFISFTAIILILRYSIEIVMSKEIKKISLFHQLFLLIILMTGSVFSFANFNYSINIILDNISTNIKITDYIFLYSCIFTLNYDTLVLQTGIDKLLASISMIYSYFFISTIFTTIITRINDNI